MSERRSFVGLAWPKLRRYLWRNSRWQRVGYGLLALILACFLSMYGIARWYIARHNDTPMQLGASFIPAYASYLGLDPKQTMQAMIDELQIKRFRLVSYWDAIESTPGKYDFSELDWQFAKAEAAGAKVSLSLGLRQPRWPECHMPKWAIGMSAREWAPKLKDFIGAVVEHVKDSPALAEYQLENEYFLRGFGSCTEFSRERLASEYLHVKLLDPDHPVVVSFSNNLIGLPLGQPKPDSYAVSVYKRVWDVHTKRYLEYPVPAWYYAFRAGLVEMLTGRPVFIHELQAEAWPPNYQTIPETPISELQRTLDARRLAERFNYGRATGMRTIDLWGAEYWYWLKLKHNDASLWQIAQAEFAQP